MQYTHPFPVDYKTPVVLGYLGFDLISGDGGTDVIEATITDDGVAADLSTAVATLYVVREDLSTVVTAMNIVGNVASVAIPVEATAIVGRAIVMVRVAVTGITRTVLKRYTDVREGITGVIVDPGDTIPSLDELLAAVAAVEAATGLANAAAAAITGITAEAETLTDSDTPAAVSETDPGDGHINLALGLPRPRMPYFGTAITGTSDTPTAYATGITYAMVGDTYWYNGSDGVNNGRMYTCTLAGNAATALWVYANNLRGAAGADITTASEMPIVDAGNHFTSTEVEGALQEVGALADTALQPGDNEDWGDLS